MLEVSNLKVAYGKVLAVGGVSFQVRDGEIYALVGESGCGKTTAALAVMRYLPRGGRIVDGSIQLDSADLLQMDERALRQVRGRQMAMVYQNPAAALNPSLSVGAQVAEVFRAHRQATPRSAREQALDLLRQVQLPRAEQLYGRYPHQLSGGMQQRIVIAIALASSPRLLVLDEPTTGLDATVEASVLALIVELQRQRRMAILFITHNLNVVARMADRVGVLYAGRLVEEGVTADVFRAPGHPYTRGLLGSAPRLGARRGVAPLRPIPGQVPARGTRVSGCPFAPRCEFRQATCLEAEPALLAVPGRAGVSRCYVVDEVVGAGPPAVLDTHPTEIRPTPATGDLLVVEGARKTYRAGGSTTLALDGVSISIGFGETFGLVGESGSGKTTFARAVAGLERLDAGTATLEGQPLDRPADRRSRQLLRRLQMVFQDPESTLNPSHTVRRILDRSIERLTRLDRGQRADRVGELMRAVQLDTALLDSRPAELSGGQKQRVAIARAFASEPALVLADEPVSALDVSVQAAILNLLDALQRSRGVSYVFISHDMGVVRYLADRVGVLYGGQLVEVGPADEVFAAPHHPYTAMLMSATALAAIPLDQPEPAHHVGCVFAARCPRKLGSMCDTQPPPWRTTPGGDQIRCHIPLDELTV